MKPLTAVAAAALLSGCAPQFTTLTDPDSTRSGALGEDGTYGAVLTQRDLRVRGDRVVGVDIIAATDDGTTPERGAVPVLLVQGGSVPVERYHWLAAHLATRGAVVVAPRFLADLAFFDQADAADSLAAAREVSADDNDALAGVIDDRGALAVGHSLGGVVAASAFEYDRGIEALALLASYPDPASTPTRRDGRVLFLTGDRDGLVQRDDVLAGVQAVRAPVVAADIAGLTHFQITDDPTEADLDKEGTTGEALEVVRPRLLFLLDALLADVADTAGADVLDDEARWPVGITAVEQP